MQCQIGIDSKGRCCCKMSVKAEDGDLAQGLLDSMNN